MAEMELVGGHFGTGRARYVPGQFRLADRLVLPVDQVASAEENASFIQRNIGASLRGMIGGGIKYAPAAMVVGLFVAPLAMVGAIGVTAAAIGAALGALGAGDKRVLMQVVFDDGRGFICVCDQGVAGQIQADARMARQAAAERRAAEAILIPPKWSMGPIVPAALERSEALPQLASPTHTPSKEPPTEQASSGDQVVGPVEEGPTRLAAAASALSSTKSLAADAAAKAGAAAGEAYASATAAADDAWKAASSLLSRRRRPL